jgi:hypothetical protein
VTKFLITVRALFKVIIPLSITTMVKQMKRGKRSLIQRENSNKKSLEIRRKGFVESSNVSKGSRAGSAKPKFLMTIFGVKINQQE